MPDRSASHELDLDAIRERAEFAMSDDMADMLAESPESCV